jgi:hypothetical protein
MSFTAWLRKSRRLVFIFKAWRFRSRYAKKGHGVVTECGADLIIYNREKDAHSTSADWFAELLSTDPWFKDMVPDVCDSAFFCEQKQSGSYVPLKFNVVSKEKLPPGVDSATKWKSVCINTALYLPWLASQCLRNGVVIKRGVLGHISEAVGLHHTGKRADLIVNCTGLLASRLGGVMDKNVIPVRGQTVVVRNDPGIMTTISGTDDGDDEVTYVMHRAAGKPPLKSPKRLLRKRQDRLITRPEPRTANHETLHRACPRPHKRERHRSTEHRPPCRRVEAAPDRRREVGEGNDRRRMDCA